MNPNEARAVLHRGAATVLALFALAAVAPADEIHRWVDANGQVHFGDRAPEGAASQRVTVRPNVYSSPAVEAMQANFHAPSTVVLYSTAWCGYCRKAREYFRAKGIAYSEYDVETSDKGRQDYARLGARGVPVILVGGKRLNGFSPQAFEQLYAASRDR